MWVHGAGALKNLSNNVPAECVSCLRVSTWRRRQSLSRMPLPFLPRGHTHTHTHKHFNFLFIKVWVGFLRLGDGGNFYFLRAHRAWKHTASSTSEWDDEPPLISETKPKLQLLWPSKKQTAGCRRVFKVFSRVLTSDEQIMKVWEAQESRFSKRTEENHISKLPCSKSQWHLKVPRWVLVSPL